MSQGNLLQWANSIRSNMANDFGREFFQQQVQTQGFLFLDDYLDNILSGTKQDPLIDLVKTPGRRRAAITKPKLASKLGNPIIFSLAPALDEVGRSEDPNRILSPQEPERNKSTDSGLLDSSVALGDTPPHSCPAADDPSIMRTPEPEVHDSLPSASLEQANLSVIAEDEEPAEISQISIKHSEPSPKVSSFKQASSESASPPPRRISIPAPPSEPATVESPDEDDCHDVTGQDVSLPINSSSEYHSTQATPLSPAFSASKVAEVPAQQRALGSLQQAQQAHTDYATRLSEDTVDVVDMQIPLPDADSGNKTTSMIIPSLPEPMPLRKSMRASRDLSVGATLLGGATPGNGKRTSSWLMKAREVRALDMTSKSIVGAFPTHQVSDETSAKGSKRKSGDIESFASLDDHGRKSKVAKHDDSDTLLSRLLEEKALSSTTSLPAATAHTNLGTLEPRASPGVLDRLKKTVEGLVGKTIIKNPTEGSVVSAIAEARAAAEARIAERNHQEEPPMEVNPVVSTRSLPMSMTDLFPSESRVKEKHRAPEKPFKFSPLHSKMPENIFNRGTTPHSPPAPSSGFVAPTVPVFNKPVPVFVPPPLPITRPLPSPPLPKEYTSQAPLQSAYSATIVLSSPSGNQKAMAPLTAHSTTESLHSERMFDEGDDVPAWMPNTQDTEYTTGFDTQPDQNMICDEDDSWPVDEKLAAGVQWTFGGGMSKEDSMTWSTLPSQSQRGGDTGPFAHDKTTSSLPAAPAEKYEEQGGKIPGAFDFNMEKNQQDDPEGIITEDAEFEDIILGDVKPTPVETKPFRPQSQMSMTSSSSQPQSQGGFLNQASKLISSALGAGKKKQPEIKKVLGKAAAAAKKQQEEADKKAVRLKEMEARRQQANQRKADEEKAKQLEEERKNKEEVERRRREREEQAEKQRAMRPTPAKKDEESQAKKKAEVEKKPELKKTTSISNMNKSQLKPAIKQPILPSKNVTFGGSNQPAAGPSTKSTESSKLPKFAPSSSLKGKAKVQPMTEDELGQPSQFLHDQMAARAKAQIQAAKQTEPLVPSESIELPDINSEYSDSDDEDRPRTYEPPNWAQSPELREALKLQSTINPDDIFGAVRPLKMEEIFRTKTSRFRARTSSANWTGTDRLTVAEEKDYAARMGFK